MFVKKITDVHIKYVNKNLTVPMKMIITKQYILINNKINLQVCTDFE